MSATVATSAGQGPFWKQIENYAFSVFKINPFFWPAPQQGCSECSIGHIYRMPYDKIACFSLGPADIDLFSYNFCGQCGDVVGLAAKARLYPMPNTATIAPSGMNGIAPASSFAAALKRRRAAPVTASAKRLCECGQWSCGAQDGTPTHSRWCPAYGNSLKPDEEKELVDKVRSQRKNTFKNFYIKGIP